MIVRESLGSYLLITQPDHAALSGAIMAAWRADGLPDHPARRLLLFAIEEHDNGWIEEDAAPTVDDATGRPHDFITAPDSLKHRIWPRALERIGTVNPLAAALIARHALHVYRRHRAQPEWQTFFAQLAATRQRLLSVAGASPAEQDALDADYRYLFLGDLASLVFCNGWTDVINAAGYRMMLSGGTLEIDPDPFGGREVSLEIRARRLPARGYGSDADLRQEWSRAPDETLRGVARGAPIRGSASESASLPKTR